MSHFSEFFIAFFLSYSLVPVVLPLLQNLLLDKPNDRSSHLVPIPRGGGVVFVLIGTILSYVLLPGVTRWVPFLCLPLAIIGMIDDFKDLSAQWRYMIHFLTAIMLISVAKTAIPIWAFPICILIITSIINFINFMDGLDGIVAGCSIFLFAAVSNWPLSGAIFGFLIWNWSPAKVFMGDVGSTFIGAVFAGLAFQQPNITDTVSVLLCGFPLFGDAFFCVLRRLISGKNIFKAHKQHLYQRLNQAGWSHASVAGLYMFAVLILVVVKSIWGFPFLVVLIFSEFVIGIFLDQVMAMKFDTR